MRFLYLLIILTTLTTVGCDSNRVSDDYPMVYVFHSTQESDGVTITLLQVSRKKEIFRENIRQNSMTTFYYNISNDTGDEIQITNKDGQSIYLKDEKDVSFRIVGLVSDKVIWPGGSDIYTIPIPKGSNNMRVEIDFDVLDIEHFENQLVVTLSDGKTVPFLFKGDLNEKNLNKIGE
ncbi:hypothetical protein [Lederbergia citri]|uniref:Uncharacterized protein n=1 Tax=Lederbergia citri TaxID=2833580 RepID=A0A942TCC6_9BACI|nr:hypothetical protein [Lederbergia citri]MBS4194176.1 hypothetical protein [Lederbergia citri]